MADTDTIKAFGVDGKTLLPTVTRLTLATSVQHWIWCGDQGFNICQQSAALLNDLRLALAAVKAGTGNVG